jgi:hypothetical protein
MDGALMLWDLETGALVRRLPPDPPVTSVPPSFPRAIRDVAVMDGGKLAAVVVSGQGAGLPGSDRESSVSIRDLFTGRTIVRLSLPRTAADTMRCAVTPDHERVLLAGMPALTVLDWSPGDQRPR